MSFLAIGYHIPKIFSLQKILPLALLSVITKRFSQCAPTDFCIISIALKISHKKKLSPVDGGETIINFTNKILH